MRLMLLRAGAKDNKTGIAVRSRDQSWSSKYDLNIDSDRSAVSPMTECTCRNRRGNRRVKYARNPSGMGPRCRLTLSGKSW